MIEMSQVITDDNPLIRNVSKEVPLPLSKEDQDTLLEMLQFLKDSQDEEIAEERGLRPGVGIAGIQIGLEKRMCAIYIRDEDEEGNIINETQYCLVNPKVISHTEMKSYLKNGEGCLSVPEDIQGYVPRYAKIKVRAYDLLQDKEIEITARGFLSICLQHEFDHFDGILYYDHIDLDHPDLPIENAMVIE